MSNQLTHLQQFRLIDTDPWSAPSIDVPSIHQAVFDRCLAALEQVRTRRETGAVSMLIYGTAGSGKTHLLGRLRQAVVGKQTQPAIFCYVRLATSPTMICRHVRRCLANDLLRPNEHGVSQMDLVLLTRICAKRGSDPAAARFLEKLRQSPHGQKQLTRQIESLDAQVQLGRNLATACEHWLLRRHRRDVGDWLREGDLPDDVRTRMNFVRDPTPSDEDPEAAAFDIIRRLIRLIGPVRPLVLCFDQIEALETGADNAEGLANFGRFIANLYNESQGVLLITCAQSTFQTKINEHVRGANLARLAERQETIDPLQPDEAMLLAIAILDASSDLAKHPGRRTDRLWPIGADRLSSLSRGGTCTPRQLIAYFNDALLAWRSNKPIPDPARPDALPPLDPQRFLRESFERRREDFLGKVEDTQTTLVHGLPQIAELIGRASSDSLPKPDGVDVVLKKADEHICVSVCNQKHNALPARLKRLKKAKLDGSSLVIVRDGNLPIPATSKVARECWQELQDAGARAVRPSFEALAALESLRSLLSDAKAGDLSSDGQTLERGAVEAWVRDHLLDENLEQLIAEIIHAPGDILQPGGDPGATDPAFDDLLEIVQQRHLARIATIAEGLGCSPSAVIARASRHAAEFGLIGDPPALVFERSVGASQGVTEP